MSTSLSSSSRAAGGQLAARLEWLRNPGRRRIDSQWPAWRREGEFARRLERCTVAATPSAELRSRADPSLHHHRLFGSIARARHSAAAHAMGDAAISLRRPRVHPAAARWRVAVAGQHAVRSAAGRRDSDRLLRAVECRPHENRVSPRSRPPLWPCDAGDCRRPFQLLVAGRLLAGISGTRGARGLADGVPLGRAHGARPQLPARGVARDVPVRRFAGAVPFVPAERSRAAHGARSCDVVRAVRNVVAHERLGLPKQEPKGA